MTDLVEIFEKNENWLRLVTLIDYAGVHLCRDVLHAREGLPTDGKKLYQRLREYDIQGLRRTQREVIFPKNENTDEDKFDITLYAYLIQKMFSSRYNDLIMTLRDIRNDLCHMANKKISESNFRLRWDRICAELQRLGFNKPVDELKTGSLPSIKTLKNILDPIVHQCKGRVWVVLFFTLLV